MRLVLECHRDDAGRLVGTISAYSRGDVAFCGTLELVGLIEEHVPPVKRLVPPTPAFETDEAAEGAALIVRNEVARRGRPA
jgi:hypothetical protein